MAYQKLRFGDVLRLQNPSNEMRLIYLGPATRLGLSNWFEAAVLIDPTGGKIGRCLYARQTIWKRDDKWPEK